jgi:hypothetical protein
MICGLDVLGLVWLLPLITADCIDASFVQLKTLIVEFERSC